MFENFKLVILVNGLVILMRWVLFVIYLECDLNMKKKIFVVFVISSFVGYR